MRLSTACAYRAGHLLWLGQGPRRQLLRHDKHERLRFAMTDNCMLGNLPITVTSGYGNLLPYTYGIMYVSHALIYRMRHMSRAHVTCKLSLYLSSC